VRYVIDSNVLLGATFKEAPEHEVSLALVQATLEARRPWCLSWVNVYEFLRVATHRRVFPKPLTFSSALNQARVLADHPTVEMLQETPRHLETLTEVAGLAGSVSGNFVHDCHLAALMREHDVNTIVTLDTHFRRFGVFKVLSPAQALEALS